MEDSNLTMPAAPIPAPAVPLPAPVIPRWVAILQAIAISGVPTQLVIVIALWFTTDLIVIDDSGLRMSLQFMATLMLLDTALIALMIRVFLEFSGEDSKGMFIGNRPVLGEILRGLLFLPVVFIGVTALVLSIRAVAPGLHTVEVNPLTQFMQSPLDGAIFILVVILGAGIKEELQRAFVLRRFEQRLGGMRWGLVVTTVVFGVLHAPQGIDVAITIGFLGLFWGVLYMKRQSAIMSMTNHAAFDAAQVAQYLIVRALGG